MARVFLDFFLSSSSFRNGRGIQCVCVYIISSRRSVVMRLRYRLDLLLLTTTTNVRRLVLLDAIIANTDSQTFLTSFFPFIGSRPPPHLPPKLLLRSRQRSSFAFFDSTTVDIFSDLSLYKPISQKIERDRQSS